MPTRDEPGASLLPAEAHADRLAALWGWLSTWIAADGGVNGPIVHRSDLKRLFAIHDTPWTQHAVIEGLLDLHLRSGSDRWLERAVRLADAQCSRQLSDGRFRWAGHEDDRFSSLVHNTLADCALLKLAETVPDAKRRTTYLAVARKNLVGYVVGELYRPRLQGFAMNPVDYYAGRDRFVLNMNSVAVEALLGLDRALETDDHDGLARRVGERIASMQAADGGLPYSDLEPDAHITIYTALALRGVRALAQRTGDPVWPNVAARAVRFLKSMEDSETGLWCHKRDGGRLARFPIFVAGAGMICNGLLDAAEITGGEVDREDLARRLFRFQLRTGAIRNFVGYDHPDNGRKQGKGVESWEDVYPTPSWNAQSFRFLCRVVPVPERVDPPRARFMAMASPRYAYLDSRSLSGVVGVRPASHGVAALFVKRRRHGVVVSAPRSVVRRLVRRR